MIPCKQQTNRPPRQIECHTHTLSSTSLDQWLRRGGPQTPAPPPPPSLLQGLVDYTTFRACDVSVHNDDDEDAKLRVNIERRKLLLPTSSHHEKRLSLLRARSDQKRRSLLKQQQQQQSSQPESVRVSMVDLIPPSCRSQSDSSTDDEESEVMFALKVSKPAKLIPRRIGRHRRRETLHTYTSAITNASGNASIAAYSLFEESMTLQSMAASTTFLRNPTTDQEESVVLLQQDVPMTDAEEETRRPPPPPPAPPATTAIAPAAAPANAANTTNDVAVAAAYGVSNGDFSQTCVPNHDSFQTTTTTTNFAGVVRKPVTSEAVIVAAADPRKKRKNMMNWLANQLPSKNLLGPAPEDPQPPIFIKVIYLNDDSNSSKSTDTSATTTDCDQMDISKLVVDLEDSKIALCAA